MHSGVVVEGQGEGTRTFLPASERLLRAAASEITHRPIRESSRQVPNRWVGLAGTAPKARRHIFLFAFYSSFFSGAQPFV